MLYQGQVEDALVELATGGRNLTAQPQNARGGRAKALGAKGLTQARGGRRDCARPQQARRRWGWKRGTQMMIRPNCAVRADQQAPSGRSVRPGCGCCFVCFVCCRPNRLRRCASCCIWRDFAAANLMVKAQLQTFILITIDTFAPTTWGGYGNSKHSDSAVVGWQ